MAEMSWASLKIVSGLLLLVGGEELLVRGASGLAATLRISPLVIGLTVVAFGTSAPELAVSIQAAFAGNAELALGNVVGSRRVFLGSCCDRVLALKLLPDLYQAEPLSWNDVLFTSTSTVCVRCGRDWHR